MLREGAIWTMYLGMAISMVGGATWPRPTWLVVVGGVLVACVGVAMKRAAGAAPPDEGGVGDGSKAPRTGTLEDALEQMAAGAEELAAQGEGLDFEAIKKRVEELNWLGPERIGAAQESIAATQGFAVYAEVMAPLATAERWLYRAWSASADGHRPEVVRSLKTAAPYAREAATLGKGRLLPGARSPSR